MRTFILTLSVILVPAMTFGAEPNNIAEAEAAFAFARAKADRLATCHDGQCVPAIHAAEAAFGAVRTKRVGAVVPAAMPSHKDVCASGQCTCGCEATGDCVCPNKPAPQPPQKTAQAAPINIPLPPALTSQTTCRYVYINGVLTKVCTPVR